MNKAITQQDLLGSWVLVDAITQFKAGNAKSLVDEGMLTYSENKIVSANLGLSSRKEMGIPMLNLKDINAWLKSPIKGLTALTNLLVGATKYMSYTGSFEVKGNQVEHHVLMSSVRDLEGTVLVREASFDDELLVLTAVNDQGKESVTKLRWRRL